MFKISAKLRNIFEFVCIFPSPFNYNPPLIQLIPKIKWPSLVAKWPVISLIILKTVKDLNLLALKTLFIPFTGFKEFFIIKFRRFKVTIYKLV